MKRIFKCVVVISLICMGAHKVHSQCPEDPNDLIINTQEKEDYFRIKYPYCDEFIEIRVNGRYIGDPRPHIYLLYLAGIILLLLMILKLFFFFWRMKPEH